MKVAGRFKPCLHMGCFDLDVFVELNQRSRKASFFTSFKMWLSCSCYWFYLSKHALDLSLQWQCPICLKNYALENVIVDPYFNRIASKVMPSYVL